MVRMPTLEVRKWHGEGSTRKFGWLSIPVMDALRLRDETFRCPECHGKAVPHAASPSQEAHGEHTQRNSGCSSGDCFDGNSRPHPNALK
jgi:hypothetical protein